MGPVEAMPLWARDAVSEVTSAKETFSSWDKCMQKAYCKYVRASVLTYSWV